MVALAILAAVTAKVGNLRRADGCFRDLRGCNGRQRDLGGGDGGVLDLRLGDRRVGDACRCNGRPCDLRRRDSSVGDLCGGDLRVADVGRLDGRFPAMSTEVMAAVSMCAVWIAAIWICREPTEPHFSAPMPTEFMASFEPVIMPLGSWRAEMVFPSSVSATVPSVMAVYRTLQAVVGILRHAHGHFHADARCDDAHAVAEEKCPAGGL